MSIRTARGDDFDAVASLLEALGRGRVDAAGREDCFAVFEDQVIAPDTHHMVFDDGAGAVIGFCALHFRARLNHATPEAWIAELIVEQSARARGIGRALLEEAERRARNRGCHAIALESSYRGAESHHLFRQLRMRDGGKFFRKELLGDPAGA